MYRNKLMGLLYELEWMWPVEGMKVRLRSRKISLCANLDAFQHRIPKSSMAFGAYSKH